MTPFWRGCLGAGHSRGTASSAGLRARQKPSDVLILPVAPLKPPETQALHPAPRGRPIFHRFYGNFLHILARLPLHPLVIVFTDSDLCAARYCVAVVLFLCVDFCLCVIAPSSADVAAFLPKRCTWNFEVMPLDLCFFLCLRLVFVGHRGGIAKLSGKFRVFGLCVINFAFSSL